MSIQISVPGSWRGVRNLFDAAPNEITDYFEPIPQMIGEYPWDVSIAYAFSLLEKSHNRALYAGCVKLHRADPQIAQRFVDKQHMTRQSFQTLFKHVFGGSMPADLVDVLKQAEKVRDRIIHGKTVPETEKRKALVAVLLYAEGLDSFIAQRAGFRPFTKDMRGYTGRRSALDKSTTAWLMKGLGFNGL